MNDQIDIEKVLKGGGVTPLKVRFDHIDNGRHLLHQHDVTLNNGDWEICCTVRVLHRTSSGGIDILTPAEVGDREVHAIVAISTSQRGEEPSRVFVDAYVTDAPKPQYWKAPRLPIGHFIERRRPGTRH